MSLSRTNDPDDGDPSCPEHKATAKNKQAKAKCVRFKVFSTPACY
jgi:hypothetical protein